MDGRWAGLCAEWMQLARRTTLSSMIRRRCVDNQGESEADKGCLYRSISRWCVCPHPFMSSALTEQVNSFSISSRLSFPGLCPSAMVTRVDYLTQASSMAPGSVSC